MSYIKRCYTSPFAGTVPAIYGVLQALQPIDLDGTLTQAFDGMAILNTANVASDNLAVVEVSALPEAHTILALTYTDAGLRQDTDSDGNPTAEQTKLNNAVRANKSDERHRLRKLNRKLDRCIRLIAKNETIIERKDGYRANREASRVEMKALKDDLNAIIGDSFVGDPETVVTQFETLFANTNKFSAEIGDTLREFTKDEIIAGVRNPFKIRLRVLLNDSRGVEVRLANHIKEKQQLIVEIAELQTQLDGTPTEGKNLITTKSDLETEVTSYGQ